MPGKSGFDFSGASQSFNVLAGYLFGKVDYEVSEMKFVNVDPCSSSNSKSGSNSRTR